MAWARVQSQSADAALTNNVVTQSITLGSAPTTGNVLVAIAVINSGSVPTVASIKDGNGVAFTLVKNIAFATNSVDGNMAVYLLVVPATPSTTVTANYTNNPTGSGAALFCAEFSGITATIDGTAAGNNQATGTITQPAYSSTAVNELLLSCFADDGDPTLSAGSWTTDSNNQTNSSHAQVGIQYKNSTGGSETGGGWADGTGGDAGIVVFALQLPAVGSSHPIQIVAPSPAAINAAYF